MKTKEERVREAVTLLKKIQGVSKEFGLFGHDKTFQDIKTEISKWVETGVEGFFKFPMYRYSRIAELSLKGTPTLALKIIRENDLD